MSAAIIRTLGIYQPFASLILHGKIETRWTGSGRRPGIPPGRYVIYSCAGKIRKPVWAPWCSEQNIADMEAALRDEPTAGMHGYVIAAADLVKVRPMQPGDEARAFVKYVGTKQGMAGTAVQWALEFENVHRVEPVPFRYGNQGVGRLLPETMAQLNPVPQHWLVGNQALF